MEHWVTATASEQGIIGVVRIAELMQRIFIYDGTLSMEQGSDRVRANGVVCRPYPSGCPRCPGISPVDNFEIIDAKSCAPAPV